MWKFQGPRRVKLFIWLVLKQCLLTNVKWAKRGIGYDRSCDICGHHSGDILHVLRDCPTAKEVSTFALSDGANGCFFTGNLLQWLQSNLQNPTKLEDNEIICSCLFGLLIWRI